MSEKLDKLQKTLQQKQPESIEREQFRALMRCIDKHHSGTGPRPTRRSYRAWFAAMMTRQTLSHANTGRASGRARQPQGLQASSGQALHGGGEPVSWSTIFAGAAIATALSLLFSRSSK